MKELKLYREVVKLIFELNSRNEIDAFRYYCLLRSELSNKSGIICFDEFCDVLNHSYGYKSLNHKRGNDRTNFISHKKELFRNSILFKVSDQDVFRFLSIYHFVSKRPTCYHYPIEILHKKNKSIFTNILIGIVSDKKFRSNQSLSKITGYSSSKIQSAVQFNSKNNYFCKINSIIIDFDISYSSKKEVNAEITKLNKYFGIIFPPPLQYKDKWYITVFGSNYYSSDVMLNEKCTNQPLTIWSLEKLLFEPMTFQYNFDYPLKDVKFFYFDSDKYSFSDYLSEYGHLDSGFRV